MWNTLLYLRNLKKLLRKTVFYSISITVINRTIFIIHNV